MQRGSEGLLPPSGRTDAAIVTAGAGASAHPFDATRDHVFDAHGNTEQRLARAVGRKELVGGVRLRQRVLLIITEKCVNLVVDLEHALETSHQHFARGDFAFGEFWTQV